MPANQTLHLALMLQPRDEASLSSFLQDIYNPSSPNFHKWLTVSEFTDRFGPLATDYEALKQFATSRGLQVTGLHANRLVLNVSGTAAAIQNAFNFTLGLYQSPSEARTFFAPDSEPSTDASLKIRHIAGLDNFSIPQPLLTVRASKAEQTSNATGSGSQGNFIGSDKRAAYYGIGNYDGSGQTLGLIEFGGFALSDVKRYFSNVHQVLSVPINSVLVDGASAGPDQGDGDTEQVIDIVEAISMAPGLSQVRVYTAPYATIPIYGGTGDVDALEAAAEENIAKQLSISWNWYPTDVASDEPIFQEFAAQGQSFFAASGDLGAWNRCPSAYPCQPYHFPEEDPWVTSVGGTSLTTNGPGGSWKSESAWSWNGSSGGGGGVSPDGVSIPIYQQAPGVINSSNRGSTSLRNGPDVSAEADLDNYYCSNGTCGTGLGGTSLAAPTWAGFMALANQQSLARGGTTYGFYNEIIYSARAYCPSCFHDITVGSNGEFDAVPGYDLVAGDLPPENSAI